MSSMSFFSQRLEMEYEFLRLVANFKEGICTERERERERDIASKTATGLYLRVTALRILVDA